MLVPHLTSAAKEQAGYGLLDVLVPMNLRGDAPRIHFLVDIWIGRKFSELGLLL